MNEPTRVPDRSERQAGRCWLPASLVVLLAALSVGCETDRAGASNPQPAAAVAAPGLDGAAFAGLVGRLSTSGGYFDTDNLISNERSYQHVIGALEARRLSGGAYLGVGPDQNFTYIARLRPSIAFIVDIRRDNLLQHLFFKALFGVSRSRLEYLCLLLGVTPPSDPQAWNARDLEELIGYLDTHPADAEGAAAATLTLGTELGRSAVPLSADDLATIARVHDRFIRAGLDLQFQSHNRAPRFYYPTYRQLLLESDRDGYRQSFLADEASFHTVKQLQSRNLIIPVVGDLAGPHALAAIADVLEDRGGRVSAFYTSNVEFYLWQRGEFGRFVENLRRLPWVDGGLIVRSYFHPYGGHHPQSTPGYGSTQLLQTVGSLLARQADGGYRTYQDLVTLDVLDLH